DRGALKVTLLLLGFGSPVRGPTEAVSLTPVEEGTRMLSTRTTRVKLAELLAASEPIRAVTVPRWPTAGALELQPPGTAHDTKVVPAGRSSARVTLLWAPALLLRTVSV